MAICMFEVGRLMDGWVLTKEEEELGMEILTIRSWSLDFLPTTGLNFEGRRRPCQGWNPSDG